MKIKKFNKNHRKIQMVSVKQLLKKMRQKTDDEMELDDFIKRLDANYKKKMKSFKTMYGHIGRSTGYP